MAMGAMAHGPRCARAAAAAAAARRPAGRRVAARRWAAAAAARGNVAAAAGTHTLVIVESPAKGRTIEKYLGAGYVVEASYGHVRDLVPRASAVEVRTDGARAPGEAVRLEWGVDAQGNDRRGKVLRSLREKALSATRVLLATDPDREGEGIAWHLVEALSTEDALAGGAGAAVPRERFARISFTEVTRDAVRAAVQAPRAVDNELVEAYFTRRALDHKLGFSISPVLWSRLPGSKSAGRVQSPALRLICEREDARDAFVPEEYWTVTAEVRREGAPAGTEFSVAVWKVDGDRLGKMGVADEEAASALSERVVRCAPFLVSSLTQSRQRRSPPAPYVTSTLQQDAAAKLRWGGQRTMAVAQQLYQGIEGATDASGEPVGGLITYMRTDGVNMAPEAVVAARECAVELFGKDAVPENARVYKSKSKNAQEAHECVRPTDLRRVPSRDMLAYLDQDQFALYTLIWQRTTASQMADAVLNRTAAELEPADGSRDITLRATGSTVVEPGWFQAVDSMRTLHARRASEGADSEGETDDGDDDNGDGSDGLGRGERFLPPLAEGDIVSIASGPDATQHFTRPPPRFNEGSLVKALDEMGIGRPSTYASVIATLAARAYVEKSGKTLVPSAQGRVLTLFFSKYFPKLVDYSFTADMENRLDEITAGSIEWEDVMKAFQAEITEALGGVEKVRTSQINDMLTQELADVIFERDSSSGELNDRCPEEGCGGKLTVKVARYGGAFVGCTNYPDCMYVRDLYPNDAEGDGDGNMFGAGASIRELGEHPDTGNKVLLRRGRFGWYVSHENMQRPGQKGWTCAVPDMLQNEPMTLQRAMGLLQCPRVVGIHPEVGGEMIVKASKLGFNVSNENLGYTSITKDEGLMEKYGGGLEAALGLEYSEAVELLTRARHSRYSRRQAGKAAAKGSAKKAKKAKNASKRKPTPYSFFVKVVYPTVKGENPDASAPECMKLIAARWKELSDGDKAEYAAMRDAAHEAETGASAGGAAESDAQGDAKPKAKRALNAYAFFLKSNFAEIKSSSLGGDGKTSDVMKVVGERWRALSGEERAEWKQAAADAASATAAE